MSGTASSPATSPSDMSAAARPPMVLCAASFVSTFDRFAVTPMLLLIALDLRAPLAATVAAASGYFLAYGLSQAAWGVLSDRYGRVRIMRATLLGAAAAGLVSAVVPSLGALVAARVVAGACFGAVVPTALTYVGDTVPVARRQRALSELMGLMALGTALATAVGGVLADLLHWRAVFAAPAVLALACSFALRGLPEPERAAVGGMRQHFAAVLRNRWALLVFGLALVEGGALLGTMTFLASALQSGGVEASVAGIATGAYGVGVWLFSLLLRKAFSGRPVWLLITIGGAQMCAGYALVSLRVDVVTVVVTTLLLGGGWSFMHSSLQTWATSVAPSARGTAVSFFAAALFCGSAVASALGGFLVERGRYALLFAATTALAVALTAVAALARRRYEAGQR
ncbi:putative MFS family arabinose efflux permease [Saccharopolyspora erythraea NRRL 2338]|uniref:Permease, MDR related, probably tetracycline resistance protein n=2 Tax=Saccharopolyspora erythraea TaxID=1836 RepID=A4F8V9_SACEN|nr:MFS transporter [Saccharopolyspora erythraea]EQD86735.1 permease [Saccharopolyspora erythraea D]PFG94281.1 putative MFS family arabinose efflux permease [Saccharopolyspora erythraea NRRL 2338]QRK91051.1 MFS transporter [Saccharopolyspora erythraea]CAM00484.1 permease, MDR related, probably tetracycline resistance protein [Saccharopolyspora erythraea NRRL 2338]